MRKLLLSLLIVSNLVLAEKEQSFHWVDSGFSEGMLRVLKNEKNGFLNKEGKLVIPTEYTHASVFKEGLAVVEKEDKYGFIDKTGKVIIPIIYDAANYFSNGISAVLKDKKWYLIDKQGKEIVSLNFTDNAYIHRFREDLAELNQENKSAFIDTTGKIVVPFMEYAVLSGFREGLAAVEKDEKVGFIDKTGKLVIPFQYDLERKIEFSEGLVAVIKNGKYGFIDKTGKVVIPFKYSQATNFKDGIAWVYDEDDGEKYIDKTGKEVLAEKEKISSFTKKVLNSLQLEEDSDIEICEFSDDLAKVYAYDESDYNVFFIDKSLKVVFKLKHTGNTECVCGGCWHMILE